MTLRARLLHALVSSTSAVRAWHKALVVLLVVILLLALTPVPPQRMDTGWDKINHLLAFVALASCACLSHPESGRTRLRWMFGLLGYGAAIELLQWFTPHRSAEWADLLADGLGILLGAALGEGLLRVAASHQAARGSAGAFGAKP